MTGTTKIAYSILVVSTLLLLQCSPVYRQKTLTFFFDGVPDTTLTVDATISKTTLANRSASGDSAMLAKSIESKFNLHKPYQEHQCEKCHDGSNLGHLTLPQPDLCFTCHKKYEEKYTFIHGPVSAGYCLACHNPHMSENKNLLARANENLCFYCHNKQDVLQTKVHQIANVNDCTSCHNPHGGKDMYFSN